MQDSGFLSTILMFFGFYGRPVMKRFSLQNHFYYLIVSSDLIQLNDTWQAYATVGNEGIQNKYANICNSWKPLNVDGLWCVISKSCSLAVVAFFIGQSAFSMELLAISSATQYIHYSTEPSRLSWLTN